MIDFCQEKLVVTNSWFTLPKRRLYTWMSLVDKEDQIVRNQFDYLQINYRFRNAVKWAKTYPSADAKIDHILLCAAINNELRTSDKVLQTKKSIQRLAL